MLTEYSIYYLLENRRRDRNSALLGPQDIAARIVDNEEFMDRTDKEDWVKFRYQW